jgi:DNA polymerase-1
MIVNVDAKALEWCVGSWLANDELAIREIIDGKDMHSDNQQVFGLPSRLIAKKFIFRLIFGGSAYSYANDPDFTDVSTNKRYWERVIQAFHDKYQGWSKWWIDQLFQVTQTKQIVSPFGRVWTFNQVQKYNGDWAWPETTIKNYPVQGTSADLMCLSRVLTKKEFKERNINGVLITTVHDSIVADVVDEDVEKTCVMFKEVFDSVPDEVKRIFGIEYPLPFRCEVSYGPNMGQLTEFKF